jgi:cytochrome c oxidase assembly protein Cox11
MLQATGYGGTVVEGKVCLSACDILVLNTGWQCTMAPTHAAVPDRLRRPCMQTVEDKIRARQENPDAATEEAAAARELTVTFNADVNDGMPWRFLPSQRAVKVMAWLVASCGVQLQEATHKVHLGVTRLLLHQTSEAHSS